MRFYERYRCSSLWFRLEKTCVLDQNVGNIRTSLLYSGWQAQFKILLTFQAFLLQIVKMFIENGTNRLRFLLLLLVRIFFGTMACSFQILFGRGKLLLYRSWLKVVVTFCNVNILENICDLCELIAQNVQSNLKKHYCMFYNTTFYLRFCSVLKTFESLWKCTNIRKLTLFGLTNKIGFYIESKSRRAVVPRHFKFE